MAILRDLSTGAMPGDDPVKKIESLTRQLNEWGRAISNEDLVTIKKDDSGTPRVILDKDGLRTSQEGIDVTTATNAQLSFNSNNNTFKIIQTGVITIDTSAGWAASSTFQNEEEIQESLDFTPSFLVYFDDSGLIKQLPVFYYEWDLADSYKIGTIFEASCDTTSINVRMRFADSSVNMGGAFQGENRFRYYLLQETAE